MRYLFLGMLLCTAALYAATPAPPKETDGGLVLPDVKVEGTAGDKLTEKRETNAVPSLREQQELSRKIKLSDPSVKFDPAVDTPTQGVAEFFTRYGSYNQLEALLSFGRALTSFNYLVNFEHLRVDGAGSNNHVYDNSDINRSRLDVTVGTAQSSWLGNVFFSFNADKRGLFDNAYYTAINRQSVSLTMRNDFLVLPKGTLTWLLTGDANNVKLGSRSAYSNVAVFDVDTENYFADTAVSFGYLFSEENYFEAKMTGTFEKHDSDRTAGTSYLFGADVRDGFSILSRFYFSLGLNLHYASDNVFSWYPRGLFRWVITAPVSLFVRYDGLDAIAPLRTRCVQSEVPVVPAGGIITRMDNAQLGVEFKQPNLLSMTAYAYAEGLRAHDASAFRTNDAGLYVNERAKERRFGGGIDGEMMAGFFRATLTMRAAFFDDPLLYDYYPLFDMRLTVIFTHREWGLSAQAGLPLSVQYLRSSHAGSAFYYPYVELEKTFEAVALNLKMDNIFDVNARLPQLYPHSGRTFHLGIRIKI